MTPPDREVAPADGVLLCDKPAGMTSHDVVAQVRRDHGGRAGHCGTLDPFATGLLVVLVGRATRLQRWLTGLPKTYRAVARLGWRSTTGDPDGELTETGRVPEALTLPTGDVVQRIPMTSAARVGGERLYRKAHRGESVETPLRTVRIERAELVDRHGDLATFEIECSAGTYVRTLVESLEDAYCAELRRLAVGPFGIEAAGEGLLPVEAALPHLPERRLTPEEARRVVHGRPVADEESGDAEAVRLVADGRLLAVGVPEDGLLRPRVVLAEPRTVAGGPAG